MKYSSRAMFAGMVLFLAWAMTGLAPETAALDISIEWVRPDLPQPWYFTRPQGIACDSAGNIYVADMFNDRIQVFTTEGVFIRRWGERGSQPGQFMSPAAVAVDASGNIYVADTYNYRIQKFDSNGAYLAHWGGFGDGDGQFKTPQ
ncbi:MAG TPA: 6-bladed beta-propeller, partial [Candidatus Hydrogenedentes bacterium]|nr:6-bladed beta-propeller [Candidatus Hydrogenedentota bacterium]